MGVHLSLEYPHFRNLQPRYVTNLQVEELAWKVRLQLSYAEICHLKVPLGRLPACLQYGHRHKHQRPVRHLPLGLVFARAYELDERRLDPSGLI
jgi:hypothetical protein